ncbi:MAG: hypothetical protein ACK559_03000, partial [bacterium]
RDHPARGGGRFDGARCSVPGWFSFCRRPRATASGGIGHASLDVGRLRWRAGQQHRRHCHGAPYLEGDRRGSACA